MTSSSEDDRQASQPENITQNCAHGSQRSLKRRLITICPARFHFLRGTCARQGKQRKDQRESKSRTFKAKSEKRKTDMRVVVLAALLALAAPSDAFAPCSGGISSRAQFPAAIVRLRSAKPSVTMHAEGPVDRRSALSRAAVLAAGLASSTFGASSASAAGMKKVVVAGATGQTGRRILERLAASPGLNVIGGVRSVEKASKSLAESSTVVRGAMVQKVAAVDTSAVELARLDVVEDSLEALAKTMAGADSLVIATGFIPGNPFQMNAAAHNVDNVGTCKLIDAAKMAGVKKVVMVSSILTNGRAWGQEKSAGFVITNAFGQVLDEKLIAEIYISVLVCGGPLREKYFALRNRSWKVMWRGTVYDRCP